MFRDPEDYEKRDDKVFDCEGREVDVDGQPKEDPYDNYDSYHDEENDSY